ncbi:MAG: glutamine amidotransferase [Bacillota bacterium]
MTSPCLAIYHLYPEHLNLYGDRGNILALRQRAQWHGINTRLIPVRPGYKVSFAACDLLFMGGGQDNEQKMVYRDFQSRRSELLESIELGMAILAICGSYQLLGRYYAAADGEKIPGLELLDFYTEAGSRRMIGDIVTRCHIQGVRHTLVGFENHCGRTYLGSALRPLGTVVRGYGNNGQDRTEGVLYKNVIGTYLHGSLLPKNPRLTDWLLQKALHYRNIDFRLKQLDDTLEEQAHRFIIKRCLSPLYHRRSSAM